MKIRRLKTTSDVIDFLGGTNATVALLMRTFPKTTKQKVSNWRRGHLPQETYLIFKSLLARRGASAPPSLWRIAEPRRISRGAGGKSRIESRACG